LGKVLFYSRLSNDYGNGSTLVFPNHFPGFNRINELSMEESYLGGYH